MSDRRLCGSISCRQKPDCRKSGPEFNHNYGRTAEEAEGAAWGRWPLLKSGVRPEMQLFGRSMENSELPDFLRSSGLVEVSSGHSAKTLLKALALQDGGYPLKICLPLPSDLSIA